MANTSQSFPIAGVGASAGGVEALEGFFTNISASPGISFVVITHLAPDRESQLPEIIQRYTSLVVEAAADGVKVAPDHVYVLSHSDIVTIKDGCLKLTPQDANLRERKPFDVFLGSLAKDQGELAISVVLSGGDGDGTLGTKAVKEHGGLTLAQAPDGYGPGHPSMPQSAIATGYVDLALPVAEMGARLRHFVQDLDKLGSSESGLPASWRVPDADDARKEICAIIRTQIGHDFSGYKDKSFLRRVQRRMVVCQIDTLEDYVGRLREDPKEVSVLFNNLLISVTNFFRDGEAFAALSRTAIGKLFENRGAHDVVRVWVPGCATGEEVYSIAILLREHMETLGVTPRVQIFATDIDELSLSVARAGRYPEALLGGVSPQRRERFFIPHGGSYVLKKEVRDMCIFSLHSVIRDPPFSRLDLVSCRNLLIYLGPAVQNQVLAIFFYSLVPGGFLFLGTAENISLSGDLFTPVDKKQRIFRRHEDASRKISLPVDLTNGRMAVPRVVKKPISNQLSLASLQRVVEAQVLDRLAPAHVVANREGEILYFSPRTGKYLETPAGAPTRNVLSLARQGIKLDLRSAFREALEKNISAYRKCVIREDDSAESQTVILTVKPVWVQDERERLCLILFEDGGPEQTSAAEAEGRRDNLDIEDKLRETSDRLQSTIEEYETALEELKTSNEEMLTVNEEMQSSNEELVASKEELQSINEEMHTVNIELSAKIDALNLANSDLRNLFESTQMATVFLDSNLAIRSFTPAMSKIFNILPTDRGRPITDLSSRLDLTALQDDIEAVLASGKPRERQIRDRNSAFYLVKTNAYQNADGQIEGVVATFVDITRLTESEARQNILISELHHRTRNLLSIVQSIASQTIKSSESLEDFRGEFNGRLGSLSRVQGLLSAAKPQDVTIEQLLRMELDAVAFARDNEKVILGGPHVILPEDVLRTLALALHELVTNAVKHGALNTENGQLRIKWDVLQRDGAQRLRLDWLETGVNTRCDNSIPVNHGFGRSLIEIALPQQFGAKTLYTWEDGAVHCCIDIPLARENA